VRILFLLVVFASVGCGGPVSERPTTYQPAPKNDNVSIDGPNTPGGTSTPPAPAPPK
jgi:hypothetical protein